MIRGRRSANPFTRPTLLGVLAVLVMIIAVVLAFQAGSGLPFVPRYTLHVEVSDAQELTHGDEIHMGGALIGFVAAVTPARTMRGRPIAVIDARINRGDAPLPVDTRFRIRMKGAIGEKYLEVTPGRATRTWRNGATVPLRQTTTLVDLDQVLDMYTPRTRTGMASTTLGLGQALAGRGTAINNAIGALGPLVTELTPVMRRLAASQTHLTAFIRALSSLSAVLAPVARPQAQLFVALDTTFTALASVATPDLEDAITQTPPALSTVISDGPVIRPFARATTRLLRTLEPGIATLPRSAPELAAAFSTGARNLPGTASLDRHTVTLARTLATYGQEPTVEAGLSRLTHTASSLIKPLQFLAPVQSTCNYMTLLMRNIASALSDNVGTGTVLRFVLVAIDNDVTGGEGGPSSLPYTSYGAAGPGGPSGGENKHGLLHADLYPNTASLGEPHECTAGNEPFEANTSAIGNPPGDLGTGTEKTVGSAR